MKLQGLPFVFLNARDVLIVSEDTLGTKVHWDVSEKNLNEFILNEEKKLSTDSMTYGDNNVPVPFLLITGYVATSSTGIATTLKRDGSDFSASIFGKMLKATRYNYLVVVIS